MATAVAAPPTGALPTGIAAFSRAVVSVAADLVQSVERKVVGDEKVRTAQRNAWDALCEDRARARARAEMDAVVRALLSADADADAEPRSEAPARPARRARNAPRRLPAGAGRH